MPKKFYKCRVCGDIHWGVEAPEVCPTCKAVNAYDELTKEEAMKLMGGAVVPGVM